MNRLISIITVCRNAGDALRKTAESVLAQTLAPERLEYIVVDGASDDGTMDFLKSLEPRFNGRLRWVSEPDAGIYDAMNKAVKMARGEFVNMLNAGDWHGPDVCERVAAKIAAEPGGTLYYPATRYWRMNEKKLVWHHDELGAPGFVAQCEICHQSWFLRRDAHDRVGLYDQNRYCLAADFDLLCRLFNAGETFVPVPDARVNFIPGGLSETCRALCLVEAKVIRQRHNIRRDPWFKRIAYPLRLKILQRAFRAKRRAGP
ncbi:MAG: glycosyltransferase [Kiritimatiellaeota bacterium]|nr:glycosyltransferase [Kiritimatiellota bacterium]